MDLVVGFDLDLTLVDPRPGARKVWQRVAEDLAVPIDVELVLSRMGPPLEEELAHWFPAERVHEAAETYRRHSADFGASDVVAMPGAHEAVAAVRRHGGRVVIATAKKAELADTNLRALGLEVDALHGWCWGETKGDAMLTEGAQIYVGDHPLDVVGARRADAVSVGVRTGGTPPDEADVILDDLTTFPEWLDGYVLEQRLSLLDKGIRELGSVLVAFSGGADSAFLLSAAVRALGPANVVAATAVSPSLALEELPAAVAFAADLGVRHLTPGTDELSRPGYVANGADRCFHCKATLLDTLRPLAIEHGMRHVATGTNADDAVAGFRPGISAAAGRGAVTPLLDAGLTKEQVREASRAWGLATADKPALACLASRIAYGVQVTPSRLARVDRVESALRALLQPTDVRVRDLGDGTARVELDPEALARWDEAAQATVRADFELVETREFRSGSMNDLLAGAQEQA
ncbi:MAG: HAD hydrolase-like protein [Actinomycetota bacterium]|nr:HAD hydrolase-like protein [Actinomycetota bacterium]